MLEDTAKIAREVCKIAECIFGERAYAEIPNSNYTQCYTVYKKDKVIEQDREIANVLKFYDGCCIVIPLFRGNTEFIKAVTLAMPDIDVKGVPWTP